MNHRAEHELSILDRIGQILSESTELGLVFQRVMSLLSERLGFERGTLVLWDETIERARIVAAVGLSRQEMERGQYALGEGITGRVLASGQVVIVPDVARSPEFLNRTGSRRLAEGGESGRQLSFICVPIREGSRVIGAMSVDKVFSDEPTLEADARLLRIVAGLISQTIRIHHLVQEEKERLLAENQQLRDTLRDRYQFGNLIGSSPAMLEVLGTIAQVAPSRATVLLLGETGVGKELAAKAIHYNSPRRNKPFVRVHCGALAPQLLESELFGHVKGAFTGAIRDKIGRFEAADGGTIFLDEIGTIPPELQVKLLRVLQEREFERVGDSQTIRVDVRVIAATNLDLEKEVREGRFREDLYYRLNVVTIRIPPLRERKEDIPRLIDFFLDRFNRENGKNLSRMSRQVLEAMVRYPWPGNVRELENAIERAVVLSRGEEFTEDLLPLPIRTMLQQRSEETGERNLEQLAERLAKQAFQEKEHEVGKIYEWAVGTLERQLIREALARCDGVKLRAAELLGINRNTLDKKLRELNVPVAE